jgi:hypothetical protein
VIRYLDPPSDGSTIIEFVDGPRAGERATRDDAPSEIESAGGTYVRSVRCADDGALRYVWSPDAASDPVREQDR